VELEARGEDELPADSGTPCRQGETARAHQTAEPLEVGSGTDALSPEELRMLESMPGIMAKEKFLKSRRRGRKA